MVEDIPILSVIKYCRASNPFLAIHDIWRYVIRHFTENKCINHRHPFVRGDNLTATEQSVENDAR